MDADIKAGMGDGADRERLLTPCTNRNTKAPLATVLTAEACKYLMIPHGIV